MQCFHWPDIITCGKHPCACVMPKRYFVFTCFANASISPSTRKRKNFDPCACARACAYALGQIRIIAFALVLASLVKTRL